MNGLTKLLLKYRSRRVLTVSRTRLEGWTQQVSRRGHQQQRAFTAAPSPRIVDLRSDTVTSPSKAMLNAGMSAPTGDDVMGEDPTILQLQRDMAERFGKEKALYVPTGTMSNLVAIMSHCHSRSSEIIIGTNSHICLWEGGNAAGVGGVHTRQLVEDEDTAQLDAAQIRDACRQDDDDHFAATQLLCLENTHNMMGGVPLSLQYMQDMGTLSRELGIKLHVDGARIFNAAMALGVTVKELCADADSVSVCLSKGLGAPLGSVLVGETEFIRLAKRARKRLGGGMRQAGVVAAMGQYAVDHNVELLVDDHRRAKKLAAELQRHGFRLPRSGKVDTNMFYFGLPEDSSVTKAKYMQRLDSEFGVKLTGGYSRGGELFRVVTHLDLNDEDVDRAAEAMVAACRS